MPVIYDTGGVFTPDDGKFEGHRDLYGYSEKGQKSIYRHLCAELAGSELTLADAIARGRMGTREAPQLSF